MISCKNDYYEYLEMDPIDAGYTLGWSEGANMYNYCQGWIDFTHNKTLIDDDLECNVITILCEPVEDFMDYS